MNLSVRGLLRVFLPLVGTPQGETGWRPPEVRPSPPPWGWSTGFITTPRTVGQVGNLEHENESVGKAGRSRWKGWRPTVRGVAMNPVDHPHGGGEGRTSGGRHPVTPWGVPTKGKKTRKKNRQSDKLIVRRRSSK